MFTSLQSICNIVHACMKVWVWGITHGLQLCTVLCVYLLCQYVVVGEECRPVVSVCGIQWWLSGSVEDTPEHHILPVNDTYTSIKMK